MKRTLILSDPHGCYIELQKMFDLINYDPHNDKIICCGDLADKGPESGLVAKFFYDLQSYYKNVVVINSNHDSKHVRYHKREQEKEQTGKKNPIKTHEDFLLARKQLLDLDFDAFKWFETFPMFFRNEFGVFVHAGIEPNKKPEEMHDPKVMLYIRNVDKNGKMMHINAIKPEDPFWANLHFGEMVFFGHSPQMENGFRRFPKALGLDGGVFCGGRLTCFCLETKQFWFVHAIKKYAPTYEERKDE